jgi:hypothetical protein
VFRYIHKRVLATGGAEQLVQDFAQSEVILGKGGQSHVLLSGQRVSLVHAKFSWDGQELIVADLGSLAGVRLNNRRVSQAPVRSGDTVLLGDVEIGVTISGDTIELIESSTHQVVSTDAELITQRLSQLSIEAYLPPMRYVVFAVAVVTCIACALYPLVSRSFLLWNSGPISNSHSLIAKDCQKCHAEPFVPVQDKECLVCHKMSEHSKDFVNFTTKHPHLTMRCGVCHMEHNGDRGLLLNDAHFCTSCHASMSDHQPDTSILNVSGIHSHPQFRVSVRNESGNIERVAVDDPVKAVDRTPIKLNHAIHLKEGLRGKNGPVTLECNSCHQLTDSLKTFKPISFDSHCRDCHALGFDERIPDAQVPHSDAEAVYPALFTEYTKLLTLGQSQAGAQSEEEPARLFPSSKPKQAGSPSNAFSVVENARAAEKQLFTRTGCVLCHSYSEKSPAERVDTNSHYVIPAPNIPSVWLPKARFGHGAHEEFSCESCHEKTRNSTETTDILLPKIDLCQQCHAQGRGPGTVESGCAQCHSYHDALGIPEQKKQTITDYLNSLTR